MLAPGTTPPGAVGEPTTRHMVLRGVLHPGDPTPARALAQVTSGLAGYHLGLAMPWIWAIPTTHTQVKAGPQNTGGPPPRQQQHVNCGYHAAHRFLRPVGLSQLLKYPLATTDQEVHQVRTRICEILASAAVDGNLHLQTSDLRETTHADHCERSRIPTQHMQTPPHIACSSLPTPHPVDHTRPQARTAPGPTTRIPPAPKTPDLPFPTPGNPHTPATNLAHATCTPFWNRRTQKTTARIAIFFGHWHHT